MENAQTDPTAPKRTAAQVNRGVAWAGAAQAVIAVGDLVSYLVVIAFWVGTADLGVAAAAMTFYVLLDTAADFGVTSALIQRDDHTPERVSTVFWFNMIVSGGLFVVLLLVGPLYAYVLDKPVVGWLLVAYGGKLVFQNVYAIPFALLRKELRFGEIAKARIVAHTAESISRIVFAALGLTIWCWTLAALTRAFVFGVIVQARHPFIPKLVFKPREVMDYAKFGLRTAASQLLFRLYTSVDQPIIHYSFGEHAAGIYYLALYIVLEPVKTISNVVIDVAFPAFARLRADREGLILQFLAFTRLNLLAVLPFLVVVWLAIPEILRLFIASDKWSPSDIATCADATRVLCIAGTLRALAFVGPPLLDGIGRPELTLRYMVTATVAVPGSFLLFAWLLGPYVGVISVPIAWAVGYPIAFGVLQYLVAHSIELSTVRYLKACWGVVGCCVAGFVVGLVVSYVMAGASDGARLAAMASSSLVVMFGLVATWQKITPRSIARAVKG
ncbi:MAG: oligosaccharide flippase family protein [Kofleriaceae bacterium]